MLVEDSSIQKTIEIINLIKIKYGNDIFEIKNLKKLIALIKDYSQSDYECKNILMLLSENNYLNFLAKKKIETKIFTDNFSKLLADNGCTENQINYLISNFVSKEVKTSKKRNEVINKIVLILFTFISVIFLGIIYFDYTSYFHNDADKLIKKGKLVFESKEFFIDKFFISKTEITEQEYFKLVYDIDFDSQLPITHITWKDAINFCNKKSILNGLDPVYSFDDSDSVYADFSRNGYRLPTKLEWYWATSSGNKNDKQLFSGITRNTYLPNKELSNYAWYIENSEEKKHDVASLSPNGFGLFDMVGNVAEFCWDNWWEISDLEGQFYENYSGPIKGEYKTIIGGFYGNSHNRQLQLWSTQKKISPLSEETYVGFRIARSYKKKTTSE